jgi:hypothetical protein|nr:MAG TPA: deuterolysin [Caudoviricetes sp.]
MIDTITNKIILSWHKNYCENVCRIPSLNNIIENNDTESVAQFLVKDLYFQEYNLYVNPTILDHTPEYVGQILFHEFTHIADAEKFHDYSFSDFKDIMFIFSEIHASEIQMDKMLTTQDKKPYSLNQDVIFNGILSLKSFMDQSALHVKDQFLQKENVRVCDIREVYYYCGYLKSLQKHNITYQYSFKELDEEIRNVISLVIDQSGKDINDYLRLLKIHNLLKAYEKLYAYKR